MGQGLTPQSYHTAAAAFSDDELKLRLSRLCSQIQDRVDRLPSHDAFLKPYGLAMAS